MVFIFGELFFLIKTNITLWLDYSQRLTLGEKNYLAIESGDISFYSEGTKMKATKYEALSDIKFVIQKIPN